MKSGTVAVVGRANAGKSTLINVLVGEKIAIVSPKPQTTRERILGVLTTEEYQIVFEDTPGIYKANSRLNDFMQRQTDKTAKDVDLILFVIDGHDDRKFFHGHFSRICDLKRSNTAAAQYSSIFQTLFKLMHTMPV